MRRGRQGSVRKRLIGRISPTTKMRGQHRTCKVVIIGTSGNAQFLSGLTITLTRHLSIKVDIRTKAKTAPLNGGSKNLF